MLVNIFCGGSLYNENRYNYNDSLGVDIKLIDGVPNWSERGADTWSPFSSKPVVFDTVIRKSSWKSCYIDISSLYENYENLTIDNIAVQPMEGWCNAGGNNYISYSYNNTNGRITASATIDTFGDTGPYNCKVFIFK